MFGRMYVSNFLSNSSATLKLIALLQSPWLHVHIRKLDGQYHTYHYKQGSWHWTDVSCCRWVILEPFKVDLSDLVRCAAFAFTALTICHPWYSTFNIEYTAAVCTGLGLVADYALFLTVKAQMQLIGESVITIQGWG